LKPFSYPTYPFRGEAPWASDETNWIGKNDEKQQTSTNKSNLYMLENIEDMHTVTTGN